MNLKHSSKMEKMFDNVKVQEVNVGHCLNP